MSAAAAILAVVVVLVIAVAAVLMIRSRKTGPPQVYLYDVGRSGVATADDARAIATQLGGRVATVTELQAAQQGGAYWNRYSWVDDSTEYRGATRGMQIYYPSGQADGLFPGLTGPFPAQAAGVAIYGPKPSKYRFDILGNKCFKGGAATDLAGQKCVFPFNTQDGTWDDPAAVKVA